MATPSTEGNVPESGNDQSPPRLQESQQLEEEVVEEEDAIQHEFEDSVGSGQHKKRISDISDVSNKKKKMEKEQSAKAHFNCFLQHQYPNTQPKAEDITYDQLNIHLFEPFANYLATMATTYMKPGNPQISTSSAVAYFSAIKMYFSNRFKDRRSPPVFESAKWSSLVVQINSMKFNHCRKNNIRISNPQVRKGFKTRNFAALRLDTNDPDAQSLMIDSRPMLERIDNMSASIDDLRNITLIQKEEIVQLRQTQKEEIVQLRQTIVRMEEKMESILSLIVQGAGGSVGGSSSSDDSSISSDTPVTQVIHSWEHSIVVAHKEDGTKLSKNLFVRWFEKNIPLSFNNRENKKNHGGMFSRMKKQVHFLLKFAEEYPKPKPTTGCADVLAWKAYLHDLGEEAVRKAQHTIITEMKLVSEASKLSATKFIEFMENKDDLKIMTLPENTPADSAVIFDDSKSNRRKKT